MFMNQNFWHHYHKHLLAQFKVLMTLREWWFLKWFEFLGHVTRQTETGNARDWECPKRQERNETKEECRTQRRNRKAHQIQDVLFDFFIHTMGIFILCPSWNYPTLTLLFLTDVLFLVLHEVCSICFSLPTPAGVKLPEDQFQSAMWRIQITSFYNHSKCSYWLCLDIRDFTYLDPGEVCHL